MLSSLMIVLEFFQEWNIPVFLAVQLIEGIISLEVGSFDSFDS